MCLYLELKIIELKDTLNMKGSDILEPFGKKNNFIL